MPAIGMLSRPFTKGQVACATLLFFGVWGMGTGFLLGVAGPGLSLQAKEPKPRGKSRGVRLDRDGAPLPKGAIARLGTLKLRGCYAPMAYTPDGKYFVCSSGLPRVGVAFFEPETGRCAFALGAGSSGSRLQFSRDGKRLTCPVGGNDNPVWDLDRRKQLFTFEGSQAGFSADSSRLITISYQGKGHCRVLDSTSGKLLADHALEAQISWAEVLPGGTKIVFRDKTTSQAVLFDLTKKRRIAAFACAEGFGATVSPDGKTLAVADRPGVRLLDLATGKELRRWKQRTEGRAVFSADGKRLAWTGYDEQHGIAYPWLTEVAGGPPRRLGLPTNHFAPPCFAPDGKALVVLEAGDVPEWRDVETGKAIRPLPAHAGSVWEIRALPDAKHLLSRDRNRWLVWDHLAAKLIRRYPDDLPEGENPLPVTSESGFMMTLHAASGTLRLRDIVSGRELLKLDGNHGFVGPPADPVAIARDGKTAALVSKDYYIRIYDLTTGKLRRKFDPEAAVWNVELSDDGRYLEWVVQRRIGDKRGAGPFVLDTHTGKERARVQPVTTKTRDHWTSSDDPEGFRKRLSKAKLLDVRGKPIDQKWAKRVFAMQASPDGRYVALSFREPHTDNFGRQQYGSGLWDRATGKPLTHLKLKRGTLRFSADSRLLFNATMEGTIEAWEITTGQKRLSLQGHLPGEISCLLFLPDRHNLVSGGADTQVLLWDLTGRAADGVWRTAQHPLEKQRALWDVLAAADAAQAHRAIWDFIADPAGSVSFLARHLPPAAAANAKLVVRLIDDLNSPVYATRRRASAQLAKQDEAARPFLRHALKNASSLEQFRRLQPLLAVLDRLDLTGDRLRAARAVEVLESIGTAAARKVLKNLATGFAQARLTREAQGALRRLQSRRASQKSHGEAAWQDGNCQPGDGLR